MRDPSVNDQTLSTKHILNFGVRIKSSIPVTNKPLAFEGNEEITI